MAKSTTTQTNKAPWYLGWPLIVVMCIFMWPIGMIMLFLKLTDLRNAKEARIPIETFLAYSKDKTPAENARAVKREKAALNAIAMTKIIAPLLVLVSGASMTNAVFALWQSGLTQELLSTLLWDCLWLITAFALAYVCYGMRQRQSRFYQYCKHIGSQHDLRLNSLCTLTGHSMQQVKEDLTAMIERGYFGGDAYIDDQETFHRTA